MSTDANSPNGGAFAPGNSPNIIGTTYEGDEYSSMSKKRRHSADHFGGMAAVKRQEPQDIQLEKIAENALSAHSTFHNYLCPHTFNYNNEGSRAADRIITCPPTPLPNLSDSELAQRAFYAGIHYASQGQLIPPPPTKGLSSFNFTPLVLNFSPTKEEELSNDLIDSFNDRIGSTEDDKKIEQFLSRMRRLGGLEPLQPGERIDIPSARMGLCALSRLDKEVYKKIALESLLLILRADTGSKESTDRLIPLAIKFTKQMDRNLIQTVSLDVQILSAKVYDLIIDTVYTHYERKNINAITEELKREFGRAAVSLGKLNRHENYALKFYLRSALEGSLLLADDGEELFELLRRLYQFTAAATCLYMNDAQEGLDRLEKSVQDLDTKHLKSDWYKNTLAMKTLARQAISDKSQLLPILILIAQNRSKLNWKFSYAAVLTLTDLSMHGKTADIRNIAFQGMNIKLPNGRYVRIPGLTTLVGSNDLAEYISWGPVKHLKTPKTVDPNSRIREVGQECLEQLEEHAPDSSTRTTASQLLRVLEFCS